MKVRASKLARVAAAVVAMNVAVTTSAAQPVPARASPGIAGGDIGRVAAAALGKGSQFATQAVIAVPRPPSPLTTTTYGPFPKSAEILGMKVGRLIPPPQSQFGDILPTTITRTGQIYTAMDDGGSGLNGAPVSQWGPYKNSFAQITGSPETGLSFNFLGDPKARPRNPWGQKDMGHLGPYYVVAFTNAGGVFYADRVNNWNYGANAPFRGLHDIEYSTNRGMSWQSGHQTFAGWQGGMSFVQDARPVPCGGSTCYTTVNPDGYLYAIANDREFNAQNIYVGRARADIKDIVNPNSWSWYAGGDPNAPTWVSDYRQAQPAASWPAPYGFTYPQETYNPGLKRYLMNFSWSYCNSMRKVSNGVCMWTNRSEMVTTESKNPWGPWSYVGRVKDCGYQVCYSSSFPVAWQSRDGHRAWMDFAANFEGCAITRNRCAGGPGYGYNLRQVRFITHGLS